MASDRSVKDARRSKGNNTWEDAPASHSVADLSRIKSSRGCVILSSVKGVPVKGRSPKDEKIFSPLYVRGADVVRGREPSVDPLELVVQFVADDMKDENDKEDGRCVGWYVGALIIDDCTS